MRHLTPYSFACVVSAYSENCERFKYGFKMTQNKNEQRMLAIRFK